MAIVIWFLQIFSWLLIASAVLSWFPAARNHPATKVINELVEPILAPVRRILPSAGGMDFSVLIVYFGIVLLIRALGG